jgi:uncharacterized LabA/DUF88 family protein
MSKITFLIDGFNLYHSILEASVFFSAKTLKWLDLDGLCKNYIPTISNNLNHKFDSYDIYYFTSPATHLQKNDPGKILRHNKYIECLRDSGIVDIQGRFKAKTVFCYKCKQEIIKYEEKETDVAISIKLIELFHSDNDCDCVVIVSGDTDIAPAIRTAKLLFPQKFIVVCFPFKRKNKELSSLCHFSFKIDKNVYNENQLPDPYTKKDGSQVIKPTEW